MIKNYNIKLPRIFILLLLKVSPYLGSSDDIKYTVTEQTLQDILEIFLN